MKLTKLSAVMIISALALGSQSAIAATTSTLTVQATVTSTCSIANTSINFGEYGAGATNIDASGTLSVQCTATTPWLVGFETNASTDQPFNMTGALDAVNHLLPYSIYTDSGRTQLMGKWDDTTVGARATGTGTGLVDNTVSIYGRIASGLTPHPDTYTGTVSLKITY